MNSDWCRMVTKQYAKGKKAAAKEDDQSAAKKKRKEEAQEALYITRV